MYHYSLDKRVYVNYLSILTLTYFPLQNSLRNILASTGLFPVASPLKIHLLCVLDYFQ